MRPLFTHADVSDGDGVVNGSTSCNFKNVSTSEFKKDSHNLNLNSKIYCELANENQQQEEELRILEKKEEYLVKLKFNILEERKQLLLKEDSECESDSILNRESLISDKEIFDTITNYECCQRNCLGRGLSGVTTYSKFDYALSYKIVKNCREKIHGLNSSERITFVREKVASK
jgi:hypothetical protein